MLTSLRVRGPFRGPSGYDHHVREVTRGLVRRGIRVQLIDVPEWSAVKLLESDLDPLLESLTVPIDAPITLHFTMPHQVKTAHDSLHVNVTTFEATRVSPEWVACNRQHALVIVPTESSRAAWLASGLSENHIRICPEGVDPNVFGRRVSPLRLCTESGRPLASIRTRFLNVSEIGPRKNIAGLLRAWLRATRSEDDAVLILKLGRHAPGWLDLLRRQIRNVERDVGRDFDHAAPVELLFDVVGNSVMPRLYAVATHYISLSHGEGWDHPMVEAGACGLRLIAPDHSAYRAYLSPDIATLLPSRLTPARFQGDPMLQAMFAGSDWWEPDQEAAVAAIRAAIDEPFDLPSPARDVILANFTWERSTSRLLEILEELLANS